MISAVERFAQVIPLNLQEIFIWYFEQKGVDNPERFLAETGVGVNNGVNNEVNGTGGAAGSGLNNLQSSLPLPMGEGRGEGLNEASATTDSVSSDKTSEQHLSQNQSLENLIQLLTTAGTIKKLKNGKSNFLKIITEIINRKGGSNEV